MSPVRINTVFIFSIIITNFGCGISGHSDFSASSFRFASSTSSCDHFDVGAAKFLVFTQFGKTSGAQLSVGLNLDSGAAILSHVPSRSGQCFRGAASAQLLSDVKAALSKLFVCEPDVSSDLLLAAYSDKNLGLSSQLIMTSIHNEQNELNPNWTHAVDGLDALETELLTKISTDACTF